MLNARPELARAQPRPDAAKPHPEEGKKFNPASKRNAQAPGRSAYGCEPRYREDTTTAPRKQENQNTTASTRSAEGQNRTGNRSESTHPADQADRHTRDETPGSGEGRTTQTGEQKRASQAGVEPGREEQGRSRLRGELYTQE
ncbi:hypothetical protein D3C71_1449200 [compost metagenome]